MRAVLSRNYFYAAAQCKEVLLRGMYLESLNWCLEYRKKKRLQENSMSFFFQESCLKCTKIDTESFNKTFGCAVPSGGYFLSHIEESTGQQVIGSAKVVFSAYL